MTVHSPNLDIFTVFRFLESGSSDLPIEWRCAETGMLMHSATIVPAAGGIAVIEGSRCTPVQVVAQPTGRGTIVFDLACPACQKTSTVLYLLGTGLDGEPVQTGPDAADAPA